MLNREQLETFATVIEQGSFDKAASALNVTRGAVSQRIKALEDSLATVVLLREKPVRPTARGELLLRHVKALRMLEGSTLQSLRDNGQRMAPLPVAIAVNADSLASWFEPVMATVLAQRHIALEVVSDDQDHTFSRLSCGEVIGCVSSEATAIQGYVAQRLGNMVYRGVASPRFAEEYFRHGITLPSVLAAPAILFNRKDALHDAFLQSLFGFKVERYVRHYIPSPAMLLNAIANGGGYGLVPMSLQAEARLRAGELVDLAPGHAIEVTLYWHHWQSELAVAQEITRLVVAEARRHLAQPANEAPRQALPASA